jgi:hypothetical protein
MDFVELIMLIVSNCTRSPSLKRSCYQRPIVVGRIDGSIR